MGWDQGSVLALSSAGGAPLPSGPQVNHASELGRNWAEQLPQALSLLTGCPSPRILATEVPIATTAPTKGSLSVATETSLAMAATEAASATLRCLAEPLRLEPESLSPATLGEVGLLGQTRRKPAPRSSQISNGFPRCEQLQSLRL